MPGRTLAKMSAGLIVIALPLQSLAQQTQEPVVSRPVQAASEIALPPPAAAAAATPDVTELAKTTQNPVGNLVSLPFQFNFNFGGALRDETLLNVNFQPVIPIQLTDDWKLIARSIVPFFSAPGVGAGRIRGLGDIQAQIYLTPARAGKVIWGAGPVFSFPTATAAFATTGSWAAGPGAVVLGNAGPFVLGGLVNHFWTYADRGGATKVTQLVLQPFINLNFRRGWAASFAPVITADWERSASNTWTVPLGLGVARTMMFGKQAMSASVQYYYYVERPSGAPQGQLRVAVALLFPQGP